MTADICSDGSARTVFGSSPFWLSSSSKTSRQHPVDTSAPRTASKQYNSPLRFQRPEILLLEQEKGSVTLLSTAKDIEVHVSPFSIGNKLSASRRCWYVSSQMEVIQYYIRFIERSLKQASEDLPQLCIEYYREYTDRESYLHLTHANGSSEWKPFAPPSNARM